MASRETQFHRTTDLKRSSGLRLSTPIRSLVERVADSAGITYSDALRLLVEEALAVRAGEQSQMLTRTLAREWTLGIKDQAQALSTIEQEALVRLEAKVEKVLGLLAEKEANPLAARLDRIEQYLGEMSGGGYGIWHYKDLDGG